MTESLKSIKAYLKLQNLFYAKKNRFSIAEINRILNSAPEYMVKTEKDIKILGRCFRKTFEKLTKSLFCEEKYQTLAIEIWRNFCPTISCQTSLVWKTIGERGKQISADKSYCRESSSHIRRSKRQFDTASFLNMVEATVCGSEFEEFMKELEKLTGGHTVVGATFGRIWFAVSRTVNENKTLC